MLIERNMLSKSKKGRGSRKLRFLATRRHFIISGLITGVVAVIASKLGYGSIRSETKINGYPFTLGIASGDPSPEGVVLWTRLAPRPLEKRGGMSDQPVSVSWEVATDRSFTDVVQRGTTLAKVVLAHSVHVEVEGLSPDRWYFYRFSCGGETSPVGRTRTLPRPESHPKTLRFAFASCQKYEMGYYTAYKHLAREEVDLVLHLGDYIYESDDSSKAVRPHGMKECLTLDDYRARYAIGKCDRDLQAAHAIAPWIVTWDDHEVSNDYANAVSEPSERYTEAEFLVRRAAAYQAYYEHMPLRRRSLPVGADMLIYRRFEYGDLATFNVLDTRQYRTDQPCGGDTVPPCPGVENTQATIMGEGQREWLFAGLKESPARWNIIAQQVQMARVDFTPGPELSIDMDKWSGYEAERRRLLRFLRDQKISNPVVLTGDSHENWANELLADFDDPRDLPVGVELMGTSISSGGDGEDRPDYLETLLAENPFVKYHNNERGYVLCEVTPEEWRAEFCTVPYITRPNAPLQRRAAFRIDSGSSRLNRI